MKPWLTILIFAFLQIQINCQTKCGVLTRPRIERLPTDNDTKTIFLRHVEGDYLLLECDTPDYTTRTPWYENLECINPSRKRSSTNGRVRVDERRRYIRFKRLRVEDSALYTCTNRTGQLKFIQFDISVRVATMLDFESPVTVMLWATISAFIIFLVYLNY